MNFCYTSGSRLSQLVSLYTLFGLLTVRAKIVVKREYNCKIFECLLFHPICSLRKLCIGDKRSAVHITIRSQPSYLHIEQTQTVATSIYTLWSMPLNAVNFLQKKTPHSSIMRAMYGMSFVSNVWPTFCNWHHDIWYNIVTILTVDCVICYSGTRPYMNVHRSIVDETITRKYVLRAAWSPK